MATRQRIKFHITEAGPKRCKASNVCPIDSSEDSHYGSFSEAQKAWESTLEETYSENAPYAGVKKEVRSTTADYEALLEPNPESLKVVLSSIHMQLYRIDNNPKLQQLNDRLGLLALAGEFESLSESDRRNLPWINKELIRTRNSAKKEDRDDRAFALKAKADTIGAMPQQKVREMLEDYKAALEKHANDPELIAAAEKIDKMNRQRRVFSVAIEKGVPIPTELAAEFEKIWNQDEFTVGSKQFFEVRLQNSHRSLNKLETASDPEAYAQELGFPNAQQAITNLEHDIKLNRVFYKYRGRNYPNTIEHVVTKFNLDEI